MDHKKVCLSINSALKVCVDDKFTKSIFVLEMKMLLINLLKK